MILYDLDKKEQIRRFDITTERYLNKIAIENGKAVFDEGGNNFVTIQKDKATGEYKFERKFPPGLENKPAATPTTPPGQEKKQ